MSFPTVCLIFGTRELAFGSIWLVRRAVGESPLFARSRRLEST
jgi:hypothetical protein